MYEGQRLKNRLAAGDVCFGTWVFSTDPTTTELLSESGYDFLIIESEHCAWNIESVQTSIMAAKGADVTILVRVAWNDAVMMKQVLDAGAGGVVVPLIRNADDARRAVAACMYPPLGLRGFGPRRPSSYGRKGAEYVASANDNIVVVAQIEHTDAVDNIDEILAVPGLTGVLIGRNDLSGSMGILGQTEHPRVVAAIDQVLAAARRAGGNVGIVSSADPDQVLKWIEKRMRFITLDCDDAFLLQASQAAVERARAIVEKRIVP